tara:strand:- start:7631 stop:7834 length:204 start_codon:yes stop_codon:yes gene_type:complete
MKLQVDDIKFENLMMRIALNNVKENIFEYMTEKWEKEGNEVIDETLADALLWIERGLAQGVHDAPQN